MRNDLIKVIDTCIQVQGNDNNYCGECAKNVDIQEEEGNINENDNDDDDDDDYGI